MTGTIINIITILIGGFLGLLFGARFPDKMRSTITAGLGLFTIAIGFQLFAETENAIIVLGALLFGAVSGELLNIEDRMEALGGWLEKKFSRGSGETDDKYRFIKGFLTASLLFCIGPMAILGSIQDGLTGDYELLAIKSILDGFAALAFSATFGVGVLFSILPIFVYQGGISLLAAQAEAILTNPMIAEMSATGGILLIGLAISSLLEIKKIRVGNFLPALIFAPLIVALLTWLEIGF